MEPKFYLATFGCRVNQADSAALKLQMEAGGFVESNQVEGCSVIVVNSCTVTHRSDQQVRQLIRRLRRRNPTARMIVTGCYAQRDPAVLARMSEVDRVLGNLEKDRVVDFLEEPALPPRKTPSNSAGRMGAAALEPLLVLDRQRETTSIALPSYFDSSKIIVSDLSRETELEVQPVTTLDGRTRPFVKIQEGCDARCAYCIVPYVRGPGRSVVPPAVVARVQQVVAAGHKEIVLTGIHLGSYGSKLKPRTRLEELIRRLLDLPGLEQIRLGSIEPMRFSRRLIDLAEQESRLAPHFHLPLQSGSGAALRAMHRSYDALQFAGLVAEISSRLPHASIGTDVMVGFPGETEALFEASREFIERMPFAYLHVFPFSRRSGTPAWSMSGQVPEAQKSRRVEILRRLSAQKLRSFEDRFLGKSCRALVLHEREGGYWTGLTGNYVKVKIPVESAAANEFVCVRLERRGGQLVGEPVA